MRQRWEIDDLIESWTLDPDQRELVANKTGATRLGFAVLLKFFDIEASFPRSGDEIPVEVVDFIGSLTTTGRVAAGNGIGPRSALTSDSGRGLGPKTRRRR